MFESLEFVPLLWNMSHYDGIVPLRWNLSYYVGICPQTLESVPIHTLEFVQLCSKLSNYVGRSRPNSIGNEEIAQTTRTFRLIANFPILLYFAELFLINDSDSCVRLMHYDPGQLVIWMVLLPMSTWTKFFNFLIWRDMKKNQNEPPPPPPPPSQEVVALTAALTANTEQQILLTNYMGWAISYLSHESGSKSADCKLC